MARVELQLKDVDGNVINIQENIDIHENDNYCMLLSKAIYRAKGRINDSLTDLIKKSDANSHKNSGNDINDTGQNCPKLKKFKNV